jgi:hypothetical protein
MSTTLHTVRWTTATAATATVAYQPLTLLIAVITLAAVTLTILAGVILPAVWCRTPTRRQAAARVLRQLLAALTPPSRPPADARQITCGHCQTRDPVTITRRTGTAGLTLAVACGDPPGPAGSGIGPANVVTAWAMTRASRRVDKHRGGLVQPSGSLGANLKVTLRPLGRTRTAALRVLRACSYVLEQSGTPQHHTVQTGTKAPTCWTPSRTHQPLP